MMRKTEMKMNQIYDILEQNAPGHIGRFREFSVLIPLVEREDDVHVLYQVRGTEIKRQPGEISFPGGAREENESYLKCAIRETCEELNLSEKDITDVRDVAIHHTWRGDHIHIFAGKISSKAVDRFQPNVEVSEIFEVPMEFFMEYEPEIHMASARPGFEDGFDESILGFPDGYPWGRLQSEQPMYYFQGRIIWGITGRITRYFIDLFTKKVK